MLCLLSGEGKSNDPVNFIVGGSQLSNIRAHVEVVDKTLKSSESGIVMLAQPSEMLVSSGTPCEQQTAIVVTPVHGDGQNRIQFEYSQAALLDVNRRIQPHGTGEILRVAAVTGSAELRCNRSLEALCNAADSELKNIGHQDQQRVQVNDTRHSSHVACVVNSAMGSGGRLVLPAIRLESDCVVNSHPEAVVLMQKPVNSYPGASLYLPITGNAVSSEISVSHSSIERSYLMSKKLPRTMQMASHSAIQLSQHDAVKPSRHSCTFCGRVCAKPSVLQKHIRTHTGERPFPCTTCGLRFKTKSNLYKHCKSRTHLCALSGSDSLSADESSCSGKPFVTEEEVDNAVDNPVETSVSGDQEEELNLNNEEIVSPRMLITDDKVSANTAGAAACKLLPVTVIDGNMYVMEQVTLPSWQPVVQQLQQQQSDTMSLTMSTHASETTQSEQLNSQSSVKVAVMPTPRSNSAASVSVDSEVTPQISRSSATREALQEHISRLISENASIINSTPMAEAPRAKRILRQSSDGTVSSTAKQAAGRPLLRTRSLTPCPTLLPASSSSTHSDATHGSRLGPSEVSRQKLLHQAASETGSLSSAQVLGSSLSSGMQLLTVPKEPHCFDDDVTNRVMLLPSKGGDEATSTDVQCSGVRIILELADSASSAQTIASAEVAKEPAVSDLSGLSTCVTSQPLLAIPSKSRISSQSAERHSPTLLSVPALCMIKSVEQGPVSGSGHPVQFAQADPMAQTAPLQCVLLGSNDIAVPVTSHTCSVAQSQNSRPVIVEVVNVQQQHQPRRGRPKGSKNRPKLAASASDPSGSVTPHPVTAREPLSASVTSAPSTESLWRLKLKDQLMRRSLSSERRASPVCQDDEPASSSHESVSQPQNGLAVSSCSSASVTARSTLLLSALSLGTSSSVAVTGGPLVIRSHSCDASVPPKKRRKTLTELGRGTAFGTRVEESAPAVDSQSHKVADSDDCVFESPCQTSSFPRSTVSSSNSAVDNMSSSRNLFPLTNSALQIMYNSPPRASVLCSSAVMHGSDILSDSVRSRSLFIRLPTVIGSKIPGLVRCSGSAVELDSAAVLSPMFTNQNTTDNSSCSRHDVNVLRCSAAFHDKNSVKMSTDLVSTDNSHVSLSPALSVSVSESGQNAACSSVTVTDETELFELPFDMNASSSGTLLLLGHSYPSLGIIAEPTFCSILSTQPACSEMGGEADSHASMYDTWRASGSIQGTDDKLEMTARETFSLYRTSRLGKDLSYAAAPAFDSRSGGVLTHSSYWKYRTEHNSSDTVEQMVASSVLATADVGRDLNVPSTSSLSGSSMEKNGTSPVGILAENLSSSSSFEQSASLEEVQVELSIASGRSTDSSGASQKRVWIFPGGYRSTESYVYVRGRGRGRYVCAKCGVRCKKPSVLRKHLQSHTDVRPHHCDICDVGFKTKGNLSKHLNSKAHHLRSSELGSSGEQSSKSLEGSSYDADLDSSCELVHRSSTVDLESDSGCELQPNSSCEVETEVSTVSVLHQCSSIEADGESRAVDKQCLMSGAETPDANIQSRTLQKIAASQNLYIDVSGHTQPLLIATALPQQKQTLHSELKAAVHL